MQFQIYQLNTVLKHKETVTRPFLPANILHWPRRVRDTSAGSWPVVMSLPGSPAVISARAAQHRNLMKSARGLGWTDDLPQQGAMNFWMDIMIHYGNHMDIICPSFAHLPCDQISYWIGTASCSKSGVISFTFFQRLFWAHLNHLNSCCFHRCVVTRILAGICCNIFVPNQRVDQTT